MSQAGVHFNPVTLQLGGLVVAQLLPTQKIRVRFRSPSCELVQHRRRYTLLTWLIGLLNVQLLLKIFVVDLLTG